VDYGVCSTHSNEARVVYDISRDDVIDEVRQEIAATRPTYEPGEWVPPTGDTTAYGSRALQGIVEKFYADASDGYKNVPLRAAAFTAGTLVGAGEIASHGGDLVGEGILRLIGQRAGLRVVRVGRDATEHERREVARAAGIHAQIRG
jgi:hypothetical protein